MRIAPLDARQREAWDALVAAHPAGGFMQSWAWARFKELEGYDVVRLGLFDGARLTGGALAYAFPSPAEAGLLAVPDGPLLDWSAPEAGATFERLVAVLRRSAPGRQAVVLRIEPRLPLAAAGELPPPLHGLARSPVDLVPDETLQVDLGPEPEMLARMKPKGRYNTRLALRRGVEVVSSVEPGAVHELYRVLEETAGFHGFLLEPKSFFINLVQALVPHTGRLAFARYKGITLAAALTVRHGGAVTFLYGGHVPIFPQVMASYALHWHLMQEAARDGYRVYDFYAYVPPDRLDHAYAGFSRFKEKFGGRHVRRVGSRDVIFYDRLTDAALGALRTASAGPRAPLTKAAEVVR
jgi:lipid II:glycine glycyltransferase (peptidoglycan interpeptide bridge formation enzyme)